MVQPGRLVEQVAVLGRGVLQEAIRRLQDVATDDGNVFDELMCASRVCSLGQLTEAFFEFGGQYRRNM